MKNGAIKPNKTKIVARVMLVVLLLSSAINLSGCQGYPTQKYILNSEKDEVWGASPIRLVATSDTKAFNKNNIQFDLSFAMYSANSQGDLKYDDNVYYDFVNGFDITYGIYITDTQNMWQSDYDEAFTVDNIESIENHCFIKKITEEEAFSEEYTRIYPTFAIGSGGDIYNHTETITIPEKFIFANRGTFVITIIAFYWLEESKTYTAFESSRIEFDYKEIDENSIEIDMEKWNVYFRIP